MYIVARHEDYEQPDFVFADAELRAATQKAELLVVSHMGARSPVDGLSVTPPELRAAQQPVSDAPDLGPALKPVACWRVHDLYDYTVYDVVTGR